MEVLCEIEVSYYLLVYKVSDSNCISNYPIVSYYLLPKSPKKRFTIPHNIMDMEKELTKLSLYSSDKTNISVVCMKHLRNPNTPKVVSLHNDESLKLKTEKKIIKLGVYYFQSRFLMQRNPSFEITTL